MKNKIFLIFGLLIFFVIIFYIAKDLYRKGKINYSPFEYNMEALRKGDSLHAEFKEIKNFEPGLDSLLGITVDHSDRIIIAGKDAVAIFANSGKIEKLIPVNGLARCVAVDQKGNIFLGMDDHIRILDKSGKTIADWPAAGDNSVITSIAVTPSDVFVADAGEKLVFRYDHSGKLIARLGEKDPQNDIPGFVIPSPCFDLGISPSGLLWVVDPGRHTFMNFTYDGKVQKRWGKASLAVDGFCGCCNPSNFAFLSDGTFVTSEKGIERIKAYSKDGDFICLVATPESFEEGTHGIDLAVDSIDRIFVLDPVKKKVRVFVRK